MLEKQYFPSTFGDDDLHQGMTGDTKSGDLYRVNYRIPSDIYIWHFPQQTFPRMEEFSSFLCTSRRL